MPAPRQRTDREDRQLIAGHFPRELGQIMRLLSAHRQTTVQTLLGEAMEGLIEKQIATDKGSGLMSDVRALFEQYRAKQAGKSVAHATAG